MIYFATKSTVHLVLEECKISLKSFFKYIIMSHNKFYRRSWSLILGPESESESRFLVQEVSLES